jgi:N-acetylglutamate synthase-like GNAT family acetyltransferase
MTIRNATYKDAPSIKVLLENLGYKTTNSLLVDQLEILFNNDDDQVFVYELKKEVVGFVSVHYLPQLAFNGGLAVITYLSVDETVKDAGIAQALERYVTEQAKSKKCERIEVHCLDWRTPTHHFYMQQGYSEYPKYFTKKLFHSE